jgi:hypothetical protein
MPYFPSLCSSREKQNLILEYHYNYMVGHFVVEKLVEVLQKYLY